MTKEISGNLHVSNDVLADLAGYAALRVYGVVGMAAPTVQDGIAKLLPASRLRRGIEITNTAIGVHVDVYVILEYGVNINSVSQNLIESITYDLSTFAQVPIDSIDVHVQGVKIRK
ncbi:Asp23/Gls24 family envelope stress response protein [Slackia heliotrinireducens]|uniref:Uncharacterized conserved protein n=1 Tax=Slackia heliotrinireducens (strain ATCC 29202 / DSM 20476 / NCTC 11029 / RHS 1) TaxID=471855 RepID=C7N550_SLAHD|nr:Asp23/Gls24 family envelope stress response protein [Slackia heliotrinireducens]ACV22035.1 uncharacterized conserved protein [Slackia heliotrinireducens DSM 20476]VEG99973.1 Protein of uncharacterised function (DUF322) [Slackia heliotrinireducens]